ncbi:alpha/beta hydrolase [Kribbella sp. NBC_01245]|uniref:alpha/beta fold hydrolase n=1 Tax=Kribbella sp. NBC_01245 TaxID=2903578 RepID=UPI002E2C4614|nr:alpha/beta hydrolase [Kribbella sp. NBC_01245]
MVTFNRRTFTTLVAAGAVAASLPGQVQAKGQTQVGNPLGPIRNVRTDLLSIAYHDAGPADGPVILLGHGWPYSPQAFVEVVPRLVRRGYRVLTPYLRGHGGTRFLSSDTLRSGQQAALGSDVIDFLDALDIPRAIFAGYDWGGRAFCVAAALWPDRCAGLVSVNSYLVQNLDPVVAKMPVAPSIEAAQWYFDYFTTERGKTGLALNTKELARVVWTKNSPTWDFTEGDLDRAAELFDNPDYVDVVVHVYRHRRLTEAGDPRYDALEARLRKLPVITVPAVTLDGIDDGNFPANDGTASAKFFAGPRVHHQVPGAGHNLPQERPRAFFNAILEVTRLPRR